MAKRPSIKAAVEGRSSKGEKRRTAESARVSVPASRVGKINVSAYFPPEVRSSIRLVQAKTGENMTDTLAEALNLLFAKYGVPETAPRGDR